MSHPYTDRFGYPLSAAEVLLRQNTEKYPKLFVDGQQAIFPRSINDNDKDRKDRE